MSSEPPDENKSQPEEKNRRPVQQSISASDGSTIKDVSLIYQSRSDMEELNDYLDWAVADFENRMTGLLLDTPPMNLINHWITSG
jgi:hypothetical protein